MAYSLVMTTSVLITGFGPFPGVECNASAHLVRELARTARTRLANATVRVAVLPVTWIEAPALLRDVMDEVEPDLVLQFGVSAEADGFILERVAVNACCASADASGCFPEREDLLPGGQGRRISTLPLVRIARALRRSALPVTISENAGRYLCNAALYHGLDHAAAMPKRPRCGFIHIPAHLSEERSAARPCLSHGEALIGATIILQTCLAAATKSFGRPKRPAREQHT